MGLGYNSTPPEPLYIHLPFEGALVVSTSPTLGSDANKDHALRIYIGTWVTLAVFDRTGPAMDEFKQITAR